MLENKNIFNQKKTLLDITGLHEKEFNKLLTGFADQYEKTVHKFKDSGNMDKLKELETSLPTIEDRLQYILFCSKYQPSSELARMFFKIRSPKMADSWRNLLLQVLENSFETIAQEDKTKELSLFLEDFHKKYRTKNIHNDSSTGAKYSEELSDSSGKEGSAFASLQFCFPPFIETDELLFSQQLPLLSVSKLINEDSANKRNDRYNFFPSKLKIIELKRFLKKLSIIKKYPAKSNLNIGLVSIIIFGIFISGTTLNSLSMLRILLEDNQKILALWEDKLENLSKEITVKIIAGEIGERGNSEIAGSGTLFNCDGKSCKIITNSHVLKGSKDFQVLTYDGKRHSANLLADLATDKFQNDLALIEFESQKDYGRVNMSEKMNLSPGDEVFVAGFPFKEYDVQLNTGQVSLILDDPLLGGYQIAYSVDVQQGMSGGPVLDYHGNLVGINGKRSNPLQILEEPLYLHKDGSSPNYPIDVLNASSWAIPIQLFFDKLK